jgi:hypothetical protein
MAHGAEAYPAFEIGLFGWTTIVQLVRSPSLPADSAAFWF